MGLREAWRATTRAARATGSAAGSGARAGASAAQWSTRLVHRLSGASGASRTGLSRLIELTAASGVGDAFVAVSLAGTIFFNTSVDQARGRIVLFLLVTMAPFAVLAPFLGPVLDRVQQGRRYILAGTLLARGLLCWGMSAAVSDPVTLLPAAFGILVLQKAYGVVRSSVAPRLLPAEITLVTANARSGLAALAASIVAAPIAAGIDAAVGAAWVLRVGTVIYLAATLLALRLPDHVDLPAEPAVPGPAPAPHHAAAQYAPARPAPAQRVPGQPGSTRPLADRLALGSPAPGQPGGPDQPAGPGGPWRTLRSVGPVVGEAMRGNATMRAFYGFTFFFLVFLLQTDHFHHVSRTFALGALVGVAAAGSLLGTTLGAGLRSRSPHMMMFGMLALATLTTAVCAWFFGFGAALAVAFVSTLGTALSKLANDSIVQREIGEEIRSSTFAVSETLNQLSWVVGGLVGVGLSVTGSGPAGLGIAAAGLATALVLLIHARRHRVRAARQAATPR